MGGSIRFPVGGVTNDELLDVTLLVRCLEENVVPNSEDVLAVELDIGPETERTDDAIDILLELRDGGPVLAEEPDAARRATEFGSGGESNLPGDGLFGDAES